jgi:hypothetical protein
MLFRRSLNSLNRRIVHLQGPMFRYKTLKGLADAVFKPRYMLPLLFSIMNNNPEELQDVWHVPKLTYRVAYFISHFVSQINNVPNIGNVNLYSDPAYATLSYAANYMRKTWSGFGYDMVMEYFALGSGYEKAFDNYKAGASNLKQHVICGRN